MVKLVLKASIVNVISVYAPQVRCTKDRKYVLAGHRRGNARKSTRKRDDHN